MSDLFGTDNADNLALDAAQNVYALDGDDVVLFSNPDGQVYWGATIDGGAGYDTVDASGVTRALRIVDSGTPTFGIPTTAVSSIEHIMGGSGNDAMVMLYNTTGVTLEGGQGNDIVVGGRGDDHLFGGAGIDVTGYLSPIRSAAVALTNGDGTISTPTSGTDTISSVEYSFFLDGLLSTDPNSAAAKVTRLYNGLFNRAPDAAELDTAAHQLQHGVTLSTVTHDLAAKFDALGFNTTSANADFVDKLYTFILGRSGDGDGRQHWIATLDSGVSREDVMVSYLESDEARARSADIIGHGLFVTDEVAQTIASLYDTMGDRRPDLGGFTNWYGALKTGMMTGEQVAQGFAGSDEFVHATQGMSNGDLVDYLANNSFGHTLTTDARAAFVSELDHGSNVGSVMFSIATSADHLAAISPDIHGGIAFG